MKKVGVKQDTGRKKGGVRLSDKVEGDKKVGVKRDKDKGRFVDVKGRFRPDTSYVKRDKDGRRTVEIPAISGGGQTPPESFLAGWADYEAGRVVDMHRALGDEPPLPAV